MQNCIDCPYIKEDIDKRMDFFEKFKDKCSLIDYKGSFDSYEDVLDEEMSCHWCDKVGGKIW